MPLLNLTLIQTFLNVSAYVFLSTCPPVSSCIPPSLKIHPFFDPVGLTPTTRSSRRIATHAWKIPYICFHSVLFVYVLLNE